MTTVPPELEICLTMIREFAELCKRPDRISAALWIADTSHPRNFQSQTHGGNMSPVLAVAAIGSILEWVAPAGVPYSVPHPAVSVAIEAIRRAVASVDRAQHAETIDIVAPERKH